MFGDRHCSGSVKYFAALEKEFEAKSSEEFGGTPQKFAERKVSWPFRSTLMITNETPFCSIFWHSGW